MPRGRRALLQRQESDEEFETPAFRDTDKKQDERDDQSDSNEEIEFPDENDSEDPSDEDDDLEVTTKADDDDDDSDDAPEDVGFSESRKAALTQMRNVMSQIKEQKLQLKTKRKLQDEKYKEQKRVKVEAMTRLSEDVINSLPEKLNEPKKEVKATKKITKKKQQLKKESPTKSETRKHILYEETEDFIPLEIGVIDRETGIKAVPLKEMRKKMAISQSAANFKNSRLYGDPRQRESTKAYLAKLEKRRITRQKR